MKFSVFIVLTVNFRFCRCKLSNLFIEFGSAEVASLVLQFSFVDVLMPDIINIIYEIAHDKTYKMACSPSEDSDQPGIHPVWSVFAVYSMGS